jgi:hypothetical protein
MVAHVPQVGAPDSELGNSPIIDDMDDVSPDAELGAGVCYFNNISYPIGQYVLSGSELLQCQEGGVWVRKGEMRPE